MQRIIFTLIIFPFFSLAQGGNQGFTLTGKIKGIADGTEVKLLTGSNPPSDVAKATVTKGIFTLTGKIAEPSLHSLSLGSQKTFQFYLENSRISVTGDFTDIENLNVVGSSSDKDFRDFKKVFDPLVSQMSSAANTINSMPQGNEREALLSTYYGISAKLQQELDKYLEEKSRSIVAPFVLYVTHQYSEDIMLLEKRYNLLDSTIRRSQIGTSLSQYIAYNKVGAVGTQAVDFTQPDTLGTPVSLSSFRGKYVLVDFWASWCRPCRMENPNVVAAYHKFKGKNFTVLGVSLDRPEGKNNWINAIHEDNLMWTQVSDLQFWNNAAAQLYRVSGIPFNMLVDPSGKIVGRNLRGPDLEVKLCEILGCN